MKALGALIALSLMFATGIVWWSLDAQFSRADVEPAATVKAVKADVPKETATPTATPKATASAESLPATAQLDVSFTSQAPFGKWDPLHEDACEEASFLMAKYFFEGKRIASKESIDKEIIDMVHWEEARGYDKSITLTQLNTIARDKFGMKNGQVVKNITLTDIKREIAAGRPVILGMAGKLLHNPNFKDGGPVYHMLLVTGYDATGFITNDPGTRLGEDYHYDYATFDNAIHDWDPGNIQNGGRNMLVLK